MMAKDWWKSYFDEHYFTAYKLAGDFDNTKIEVSFLVKNIPIKKNFRILDLCCGQGRHTLELAKRGYYVSGLDYSAYLLKIAIREASKNNLKIIFKRADARKLSFAKKFGVILNLFTAFGYGSKEDDGRIIKNVSKSLKKGGFFLIDLMNPLWLWRNYKPHAKEKVGPYKIVHNRNFDFLNNVNYHKMQMAYNGSKKTIKAHNRFYTLAEIKDLFQSEGLKVVKFWGSFKGEAYGLDSRRMIVLAKKS